MSIIRARRLDLKETRPLTPLQKENSTLNEQEALAGAVQLRSCPRRLVLEMTSACNIRCKMCGRTAAEFTPTVFQKKWLSIFEPIADQIEEVTLLGWGEPTLHPEFSDFLAWAHSHGLRIFFCTNGTRLKALTEDIFRYQVDLLTVSLDGADAETNNSIRCGADFDTILADVAGIAAKKRELGVEYPYISFVMTLMESNFRSFPDYVRLAKRMGIQEVKGVYLTVFDDIMGEESMEGRADELRIVYDQARVLGEELGIAVKLPHLQGEDIAGDAPHKDCYVGWRDFFLGSDGYIRSCMSTPVKLFRVGDYETFAEMWNSPEYQAFRASVNTQEMCMACRNCYQASAANWNKKESFDQRGQTFAPEWEG